MKQKIAISEICSDLMEITFLAIKHVNLKQILLKTVLHLKMSTIELI